MVSTSKALLLAAAALAVSHAPLSSAAEVLASASTVEVDAASGSSTDVDLGQLSSAEFLTTNPPEVVLASSFPTPELHTAFEEWKLQFSRAYKSAQENALRKLIWLQNHARIESHNAQGASYELGHNDFSDLTHDEFQQRFYLGEHSPGVFKPKGRSDGMSWSMARSLRSNEQENWVNPADDTKPGNDDKSDEATVLNVPESKDWVKDGAVTPVKNQWLCGSCWAFSAIGAIEGARFVTTGNLTELSVQQLIDCDNTDLGCGGGLMDQAFQYGEDAIGLCALADYPYAYHQHWFWGCNRYSKYCSPLRHTKVKKFVDVQNKSEVALKAAIATQPVSVAVSAGPDWQFYRRGVYSNGCNAAIDHGVLAVGYGHYDPSNDPEGVEGSGVAGDYWLIKNSWGGMWGMDGYIRLARGDGTEDKGGTACVLTMSSRPIMKPEVDA